MTETCFTCDHCGEEYPASERHDFEGGSLCSDCFDIETVACCVCGTRIISDENSGNADTPLCERCYERYYTTCERCGCLLHYDEAYYENDDDDGPYCYSCHERNQRESTGHIHDYYYKPEPIFYGDGFRFYGVELEIDGGGELGYKAKEIEDEANDEEERIYIKHDGSLDDGMEIVTHPMTLDYHMKTMPWERITSKAKELGYTSHTAGTCGLHIHVSRAAFGDTEAEQDACIARILYFFEKHWEELLKFSRRTRRQLKEWANRYGYKEQPKEILDHAKGGTGRNRYTCVNLTNRDTIEFRIFRGTLKLNTVYATLQLVDRICDVAFCLTDDEIKAVSWTDFAAGCTAPELVQYLKERRLYVNEPVESECEI